MKLIRVALALAIASGVLAARPAMASFHFMQIEQVIGGVNGDVTAQAIQLRMRSAGQNLVQQARLIVRDQNGLNPVLLHDMTTSVPNSAGGSRVLLATPSFATYCAVTPNFPMVPIPPSYLTAGSLTFESDGGIIYWRLSWGGASYTGAGTGSTTNDADGNFSPPFPSALPSSSTEAVRFRFSASTLSTNNANDYLLSVGAATFTNNAGGSAVVTPPPSCTADAGLDLFTTPAGGATQLDFSDHPIPGDFFGAGSDPKLDGVVILYGEPIAPSSPFQNTDTVVRRNATATIPNGSSPPITVPIEIVALNLVSATPITVTYNGGQNPEPWNLRVALSSVDPQPLGSMILTPDPCSCPGTGTFTASLPVLPRLIFTRTVPADTRVLDFGQMDLLPLQFQTQDGHWANANPGDLGLITVPTGLSLDHDQNPGTPPVGPQPASSPNFFAGLRAMRCDSSSCTTADIAKRMTHEEAQLAKHGVIPAQTCASGDTDGDGICNDADNCPNLPNSLQLDTDRDGIGDGCDNCRTLKNTCQEDDDHDGTGNICEFLGVPDVLADRVMLGAPIPNPSRGTVAFTVGLPRAARAKVAVYDVRGRLVDTVLDRQLEAGVHPLRWAGRAGSGTYFIRLDADGVTQTRAVSLVR